MFTVEQRTPSQQIKASSPSTARQRKWNMKADQLEIWKMVFGLLWSSCFWRAQNLFALHAVVLYSSAAGCEKHLNNKSLQWLPYAWYSLITSALCRETALTNQAFYALGRRQTALYSMGRSHYGSSPQMTIHWSYRGGKAGKKKRKRDVRDVNSHSRF